MENGTVIIIKECVDGEFHSATIESSETQMPFDDFWESVLRPAIIGFGYAETTVDRFVGGHARAARAAGNSRPRAVSDESE